MRLLYTVRKVLRALWPLLWLLPLLLPVLLNNCVTEPTYLQHPLESEIISPRPGHDGKLTNRARVCVAEQDGKCIKWGFTVKEYDLSDPNFRTLVNRMGFICSVGCHRYKICIDKPGFCRVSYTSNWIGGLFGQRDRHEDYLPISPYQAVLDANVRCFNQSIYNFADAGGCGTLKGNSTE